MANAVMRLARELKKCAAAPSTDTSVVLAYCPDESNIKLVIAMVMGAPGSPYEGGFFFLKFEFKDDYPFKPPHVTWLSSDDGKVRMNPNLYAGGKVCLSILGTWTGKDDGQSWSQTAGIVTVCQAVQFAVMTEEPFYNEPGFEKEKYTKKLQGADLGDVRKRTKKFSTNEHQARVDHYSDKIHHESLRIGVCDVLEDLLGMRKKGNHSLHQHFEHFRNDILRQFNSRYERYVEMAHELKDLNEGKKFHVEDYEHPQAEPASSYGSFGAATGKFDLKSILSRLEKIRKVHQELYATWVPRGLTLMSETNNANLVKVKADAAAVMSNDNLLKEGLISCDQTNTNNAFEYNVMIAPTSGEYKGVAVSAGITIDPSLENSALVTLQMLSGTADGVLYHPNVSPEGGHPHYFTKDGAITDSEKRCLLSTTVEGVMNLLLKPMPSPFVCLNNKASKDCFSEDKDVMAAFREKVGYVDAAVVTAIAVEPKKEVVEQKPVKAVAASSKPAAKKTSSSSAKKKEPEVFVID